jgi:hypothetical protein
MNELPNERLIMLSGAKYLTSFSPRSTKGDRSLFVRSFSRDCGIRMTKQEDAASSL